MIKRYDKVTINCNEKIDENIFNTFCIKFNNEFQVIDTFFNINHENLSIYLISKEELDYIVKTESNQYKNIDVPNWLVGFSTFKKVFVVIPTIETLNELYKVALHEIVHLISYKLNTKHKRIKLLDEGLAIFLSNQYAGKTFTPWVNAYLKNNLPQVSDFLHMIVLNLRKKRISIFLLHNRLFD